MPELPDVETFKRYLDSTALHKEIVRTEVDDAILRDISRRALQRRLKGRQIESSARHGKYLFARLSTEESLVFHFGMTGFFRYFKDREDSPSHTRLLLNFDNDYFLAFDCQRKLGLVTWVADRNAFLSQHNLGPDALSLSKEEFTRLLSARRGQIKSTLMNQEILAGIGNVYSDEILFQAQIHPETRVDALAKEDLRNLFRCMQRVLEKTIEKQADRERFPRSYLTRKRKEGSSCPRCNGEIAKIKVIGRTTYFCPVCQGDR